RNGGRCLIGMAAGFTSESARRYADAPTAVPLTARGGGEFLPSNARQLSAIADARRTAAYTPFFIGRRLSSALIARQRWSVAGAYQRILSRSQTNA
ncbi:hypothetical protein, partial [Mesorhizobium huakuii]|uniref:hypothetical protein n=1 Tax=Mesorhizobium huakuii TaxID=28104 RepID=UPI0024E13B7A